ncbi:MAG: hypothetical protein JHC55_24865, partial [Mycolicibacterium sp.]|nr:hypothetical protein [Mycolicibacterium sp.]
MRVVALLVAVALTAAEAPSAYGEPMATPAEQLIVVTAPTADSEVGRLAAYERTGSEWTLVRGPMDVDL